MRKGGLVENPGRPLQLRFMEYGGYSGYSSIIAACAINARCDLLILKLVEARWRQLAITHSARARAGSMIPRLAYLATCVLAVQVNVRILIDPSPTQKAHSRIRRFLPG